MEQRFLLSGEQVDTNYFYIVEWNKQCSLDHARTV